MDIFPLSYQIQKLQIFLLEKLTDILPLSLQTDYCTCLPSMHQIRSDQSLQSCLTLSNHVDSSLPGSSVHGILQARILEWVAVPSSRGSSDPGIKPASPAAPAVSGGFFTTSTPGKPRYPLYLQAIKRDLFLSYAPVISCLHYIYLSTF